MKNKSRDKTIEQIANQIRRSEVRKNTLTKDICKLYEDYLQIVRKCLTNSVEKGIYGLFSELSKNDLDINEDTINNIFEKNICSIINSQLPLITIEQLKLNDNNDKKKDLANLNAFKELVKFEEYQSIKINYENDLISRDSLQLNSNDNWNNCEYYEYFGEDKPLSVNLDDEVYLDSTSEPQTNKSINQEIQIVASFIEMIEDNNGIKLNDCQNKNENAKDQDLFIPNQNLDCFDLIDKSLTNLLWNLSYKINLELFKSKLIKKIISEETFKSLTKKNYMIKYPHPFVINYTLNFNKILINKINSSGIKLFHVNNIELEFYNINLSICRNKINELKNKFKILYKKQGYWKNKELNLNHINK